MFRELRTLYILNLFSFIQHLMAALQKELDRGRFYLISISRYIAGSKSQIILHSQSFHVIKPSTMKVPSIVAWASLTLIVSGPVAVPVIDEDY